MGGQMKGWVTWLGCATVFISLVWYLIQYETYVPGMLYDVGLIIMVIGLGRKIEKPRVAKLKED
jgi:hypothetical protein